MKLVILGAGKYSREIGDVAVQTEKYSRIDFLDDLSIGARIIGKCGNFIQYIDSDTVFFAAFGDNDMRKRWLGELFAANANVTNIVHPTAYISPTAKIGRGVAILPNALINSYSVIEDGCIINSGAIIDHDTTICAYTHICVGAIVKADNRIPGKMKVEAGVVVERNTYQ